MKHYCTYFDSNYLAIGLSLYQSLLDHEKDFQLWILCLDEACLTTLTGKNLSNIRLISLEQLEQSEPALADAKSNRSIIEYYFTCTASFMAYLFSSHKYIEFLTYLDSDLFFFDSTESIYSEIADASIAIIAHRYSAHLSTMRQYGDFNVGWVSFRRDQQGQQCLSEWKTQCLDWCYDSVEETRFADQKYLNNWPQKFSQLTVIDHKGANVAPWNLSNYPPRIKQGKLYFDNQPLVFFHFHGLKQMQGRLYDTGLGLLRVKLTPLAKRHIYLPYLRCLRNQQLAAGLISKNSSSQPRPVEKPHQSLSIKNFFKRIVIVLYSLLVSRCYLLADK